MPVSGPGRFAFSVRPQSVGHMGVVWGGDVLPGASSLGVMCSFCPWCLPPGGASVTELLPNSRFTLAVCHSAPWKSRSQGSSLLAPAGFPAPRKPPSVDCDSREP